VYFLGLNAASILVVRMLGVDGRGNFAMATLIPTLVSYVGWLGLPAATTYLIAAEPQNRSSVIGTARSIGLFLSVLLGAVSLILCLTLPLDEEVRSASILFTLFVPLNMFYFVHRSVLQAELRTAEFNVIRISGVIAYVLLLAGYALFGGASLTTVVLAQLFGNVVWFVASSALIREQQWFRFDKRIARSLIAYGSRAHIGTMGSIDNLRIDQLFLAILLTSYDLGIYVVTMTFVLANRMIGNSIGLITFPLAARSGGISRNDPVSRQILSLAALGIGLSIVAAVIEILTGRFLLHLLFDIEDSTASDVLTVLCLGSVFMNFRQIIADILRGVGRPSPGTWAELSSLILLTLFAALWWGHGVLGVAWAVTLSSALSFFLIASMAYFGSQNEAPRHRRWKLSPLRSTYGR
jgi:O-antigen/teichoic acid export membrane protein